MNGITMLSVGDKVMCQKGDADDILCPTHTYRIAETRRNQNMHMEVRVTNSQGETHSPWFPVVPHFL